MDQVRIGKFIAKIRNEKNMTHIKLKLQIEQYQNGKMVEVFLIYH